MPSPTTLVMHFTHEDNLERILDQGGLLCDRACQKSGLNRRNIAYTSIKAQRARTVVEVPPGGTLDQYVPFYFGPKSPMMLTYKSGNVTGKREDLSELLYFVTAAQDIAAAGLPFAFTDGHPIVEPRLFFNDLVDLREVDLPLMKERDWFDYDDYPDRKRRRQAEFLVWEKMPLEYMRGIVTMNEEKCRKVLGILESNDVDLPCRSRPGWYY
ncbi:DUF4433 domain-containing protein [Actinoplanes sp. NPDC049599]|uniref:type II toxin-antitoxin system toxin DNA ADP-ribosyl transferase DarT n=1 Tax=Actinoplanes sp. NPDC049599 TaxID=3363903 RepID=UPI003787EE04